MRHSCKIHVKNCNTAKIITKWKVKNDKNGARDAQGLKQYITKKPQTHLNINWLIYWILNVHQTGLHCTYQARCVQKPGEVIQNECRLVFIMHHSLSVFERCLHFLLDNSLVCWMLHHGHCFSAFVARELLWRRGLTLSLGAILTSTLVPLATFVVTCRVALYCFQSIAQVTLSTLRIVELFL